MALRTGTTTHDGKMLVSTREFDQTTAIKEKTDAAYMQDGLDRELGGMPATTLVGVRYEKTDVRLDLGRSPSPRPSTGGQQRLPHRAVRRASALQRRTRLQQRLAEPGLQHRVHRGLKGRFVVQQDHRTRAVGNLSAGTSAPGRGRLGPPSIPPSAQRNAPNPELKPLESDNFDLALE